MNATEQDVKQPHGIHAFRNRLFWRWSDELPRPLREGFVKVLHAFGAGANESGRMVFRDGRVITLKEIARAACVDVKDARRYVDAAMAAGVVSMDGMRKRGHTPVYSAVLADAPDWAAAVEALRETRSQPKRRAPRVWETEEGKGDAPASPPEGGKGDAPPSEKGGCTPEGKGDAPLTSQGSPSNYPKNYGDGRRPTTGSGGAHEGGSAAAATASPAEEETKELRAAAVGCVLALMPTRLRDRLPNPVPTAVVDAIRTELARGLTADQLVERVGRRWQNHGYENDAESADGPGILRPVGVAIALVRRGQCTSERCDDGTDVDTGARCRTCERETEDRKRRREAAQAPVQGTILVGVPSGATDAAPAAPRPARRLPAQRTEIRDCERDCGSVHRTVPAPAPAGLCPRCTADDAAQAANG